MTELKKILVVDDENGIRCLLSEVLASEGFEVSMAKDGQESLDQLEKKQFDLVITDIQMPRVDGITLVKRMKEAGRREKVIVMTGSSLGRNLCREDMPPVVTRLQKPFRMHSFLDVVTAAMANKEVRTGEEDVRQLC